MLAVSEQTEPRAGVPQWIDLGARRVLRNKLTRRRRIIAGIVAAVVLAVVAGGIYLVRFSPAFVVSTVSVQGTHLIGADTVRTTAAVPMGQPVAAVDTQAIAKRVASLKQVASVTVSRDWPHGVTIRVTERTAAFQRRAGASYQWVDASGIIFHTAPAAQKGLITATTSGTDNRILRDVATVMGALPASLRGQVTGITATGADSITLRLSGNRTVVWGSAENSELKASVLGPMLTTKGSVFNVSSPANPTTR